MARRLSVIGAVTAALPYLATPAHAADGIMVTPAEVVLYVSPQLKSRDFIKPLVCALERVLVAPVYALKLDFTFSRDMLATRSQYDVEKVANKLVLATEKDGGPLTFKYLLLPYDLKDPRFHYVFAMSFGEPHSHDHVGVVSTARLDVTDPTRVHHIGAEVTALRVYKIILKSIARLSGLRGPDRCILTFPRSLAELIKNRLSSVRKIAPRLSPPACSKHRSERNATVSRLRSGGRTFHILI